MVWFYAIWVPAIIAFYSFYAYLSKTYNETRTWKTFVVLLLVGVCPCWPIVCRFSKNLLFDSVLYDNLMFLAFAGTLVLLGTGYHFRYWQWIGLVLIVAGSICLRIQTSN